MELVLISDVGFNIISMVISAILGFLLGYWFNQQIVFRTIEKAKIENFNSSVPENYSYSSFIARDIILSKKKAIAEPKGNEDDLKVIVGIESKIETLLKKNGIKTYSELADQTPSGLRAILSMSDDRYVRIIDPETWPAEAELIQYQRNNKLISSGNHHIKNYIKLT